MTDLRDLRDAFLLWFAAAVLVTLSGALVSYSDVPALVRLGLRFMGAVGYVTALAFIVIGAVNVRLVIRKLRDSRSAGSNGQPL